MTTKFGLQLLLGAGVSPSGFQVSWGFLLGKILESVRAQLQTTGSTRTRFRRKGFMMGYEVTHEIVGRKGRTIQPQHHSAYAAPARSCQSRKPPLLPTEAPWCPHGHPQRWDGLRPREPPFRAGRRAGGSRRANPRSHPERGDEGGRRCHFRSTLSARQEGILQDVSWVTDERIHSPRLWRLNIHHILVSTSKLPNENSSGHYGPRPAQRSHRLSERRAPGHASLWAVHPFLCSVPFPLVHLRP